jgi:hypothetical protein
MFIVGDSEELISTQNGMGGLLGLLSEELDVLRDGTATGIAHSVS